MPYPMITLLVALYVVGGTRIARLCFDEENTYPNWGEPLALSIGWPILLIVVWVRATWAFFAKGDL